MRQASKKEHHIASKQEKQWFIRQFDTIRATIEQYAHRGC